jgi:hypothetical protein
MTATFVLIGAGQAGRPGLHSIVPRWMLHMVRGVRLCPSDGELD